MARHERISTLPAPKPSLKKKLRWECNAVQLVATPVNRGDWNNALESAARALYQLEYQLQEGQPVTADYQVNSTSLIHQGSNQEPLNPTALTLGEDGDSNGELFFKHAS